MICSTPHRSLRVGHRFALGRHLALRTIFGCRLASGAGTLATLVYVSSACSSPESDTTADAEPSNSATDIGPTGSQGEPDPVSPASTGASAGGCLLKESSANPTIRVTGRVCGDNVDVQTQAGLLIRVGRSSVTDPEEEIRVISVTDNAAQGDETTDDFFDNFGLLLNLAFDTGPQVGEEVSTHTLASGLFALCNYGTLVLSPGPVNFELSGVADGAREGTLRLGLTGMLVGGYSTDYGELSVPVCGGEVDVLIEGPFEHR